MNRRVLIVSFFILSSACSFKNDAGIIEASLIHSKVSNLSEMFVSVEMEFSNSTAANCKIQEYEVRWKSGMYKTSPKDFHISANQTVRRSARIFSDSEDLKLLQKTNNVIVQVIKTIGCGSFGTTSKC